VSPNSEEGTYTVVLYKYLHFVIFHTRNEKTTFKLVVTVPVARNCLTEIVCRISREPGLAVGPPCGACWPPAPPCEDDSSWSSPPAHRKPIYLCDSQTSKKELNFCPKTKFLAKKMNTKLFQVFSLTFQLPPLQSCSFLAIFGQNWQLLTKIKR
jgi:hypothetical protein